MSVLVLPSPRDGQGGLGHLLHGLQHLGPCGEFVYEGGGGGGGGGDGSGTGDGGGSGIGGVDDDGIFRSGGGGGQKKNTATNSHT